MTGPDAGSYRRQLCRLRQEIEAARDSAADAAGIVELDQARVGRLSRMDALQAQAMSQASGRRQQRMLHEIDGSSGRVRAWEVEKIGAIEIQRRVSSADPDEATLVSGEVIMQGGQPTDARPGRLLRGAQAGPSASRTT